APTIASAIAFVVRSMTKLRSQTAQNAFTNFTCVVDGTVLLLTSGAPGPASAVNVAPAANSSQDASGLLRLGPLQGGREELGIAVTRPRTNPSSPPPANYYLVGDHAAPTAEVASVQAGSDGTPISTDQPYIDAFHVLDNREDVSLLAVPGIGSTAVVGAG